MEPVPQVSVEQDPDFRRSRLLVRKSPSFATYVGFQLRHVYIYFEAIQMSVHLGVSCNDPRLRVLRLHLNEFFQGCGTEPRHALAPGEATISTKPKHANTQ